MMKTIMIINHVQVTSHYRHWQRQTDGSIVTTFWWLAGCTTHHISGSATLRWGSQSGKIVNARGLHGLACRRSASTQQRHYHLNDIIWRDLKRAQVHAVKEPVGLMRQDGKRPDGSTILPRSRGKPLAWDVTVPDTCRSTCGQLSQTGRRCSQSGSQQQGDQIRPLDQDPLCLSPLPL